MSTPEAPATSGGLLASARAFAHTLIALSKTRLEIVLNEIEEERLHIARQIILAVVAAFCLLVGALLAVSFLVVLFWETHRLLTLGLLALAFTAGGAGLVMLLRARAGARTRPFSASLGELAKDLDRLSNKP